MERRYIGIDWDGAIVRVAIVEQNREAEIVLGERPAGTREELAAALHELVGDTRTFGDRLAVAVPATESFVRWLTFPFADPRKIESALPFELSAQIPVPIERLTMDFQTPVPTEDGGARAASAAVRTEVLEEIVVTYDGHGFTVHVVDIAPFAYARGLRDKIGDGLLACLGAQETTVALLREGRVADYRVIPGSLDAEEAARVLLREGAALQRDAGMRNLPTFLIGAGATAALVEELRAAGRKVEIPLLYSAGREVAPEFLPAAALALRAAVPGKEKELNFRKGPYALKNEWTALKRELIATAAVLLLAVGIFAVSAWLRYDRKAERLEVLDSQIQLAFRESFPGVRATGNIPMQMQSSINQLREKARLIGTGPQGSPLTLLEEISRRMPTEVKVDVRDMNFTPEGVRLDGITTSFDAINQISRSLQESPLFEEAQIADAKASIDGTRVDFRLNLTFGKGG